jgi:hypothetical protein
VVEDACRGARLARVAHVALELAVDLGILEPVPDLDRRAAPESVAAVLEWRRFPLSTQEVATVCDIPFAHAREALGRIAAQEYVGADGFWSLNGG